MDMIIVHHWFAETGRRVVVSLSFSTPSCFLTQPGIQLCHRVLCICPASLTCLSHMCWPSVQCMCRRFSELLCSAWDFLDKGIGAVSPCTCTMSRVCDHTFGQHAGGWLQLRVCLFIVGCSPFSSSHSVSAGIDLHLTYLSEPRQTGEVIALWNCNHVKGLRANPLTYSIIPSLKWFALLWAGRPELPEHHTHLSGEMRQRKRGQWVSMLLTSCRALKPVIAQITSKLIPFPAHDLLYQPLLSTHWQEEAC